jgi:hypothetical protein
MAGAEATEAAPAGLSVALCWARPACPAQSMRKTLHADASELWNCELRFIVLGFISVLF